jgi:hypothetical protein
MYGRGVPGGALNLNSTGYPDHGRYEDLPLQGKIPTAESGIEPVTSWLVVRSSDHQVTRQVIQVIIVTAILTLGLNPCKSQRSVELLQRSNVEGINISHKN